MERKIQEKNKGKKRKRSDIKTRHWTEEEKKDE